MKGSFSDRDHSLKGLVLACLSLGRVEKAIWIAHEAISSG